MKPNQYLLIKRWKSEGTPDEIRRLTPGSVLRLKSGERRTVVRVGIGKILLEDYGWVDWREVEVPIQG